MNQPKFYSISEAIKMLPYIRSYSKSIKLLFMHEHKKIALCDALEGLTTLDANKYKKINRILDKLNARSDYGLSCAKRWRAELESMNLYICCPNMGIIDIPVWDDITQKVMLLCVNHGTTTKELFWHELNENYNTAHPCWANPGLYEKRVLKYVRNR